MRGRVQGVFFRDSVRRLAEDREVRGWVRNDCDGAVEAVFEGPREAVEALVAFCGEGPPRAHVETCEVTEAEPEGLEGFQVR